MSLNKIIGVLRITITNAIKIKVVTEDKLFGPKRDEVTGDSRKLHNEELHNLYFSSQEG
jgi:hypothetical protein